MRRNEEKWVEMWRNDENKLEKWDEIWRNENKWEEEMTRRNEKWK